MTWEKNFVAIKGNKDSILSLKLMVPREIICNIYIYANFG